MSLKDETIELANKYEGNISRLCADIGVTRKWFYDFRDGKYDDPGTKRVQNLYDYLTLNKAA